MSLKEALETYKHIELTEEEADQAILWAKQRKEEAIKAKERESRAEENRRNFIDLKWDYETTRGYALYRAGGVFKGEFQLDVNNEYVFDMLCHYFSESDQFISMAKEAGVKEPSLSKGILLVGNPGSGKTWMMKIFSKNKRQVYHISNAKNIASIYQTEGLDSLDMYIKKHKNAVNDKDSFYHRYAGLCLDDIGTEDIKNNYGNKVSVISEIVERRYAEVEEGEEKSNVGIWLHGTTNFSGEQIGEFYGPRFRSRVREIFNYIELPGSDRRK